MPWKARFLSLCFVLACAVCQAHSARPRSVGDETASRLNARFDATAASCDAASTKPAYDCNGVLIRATDAVPTEDDPDRHAWEPTTGAGTAEALSFSYLRKDVGSRILYGEHARPHGLIIREADANGSPGMFPVTVLCSFPHDAVTGGRGSLGCAASSAYPVESRPCKEQGIDTVEAWRKHFAEVTTFPEQFYHQCGFDADQAGFALSIASRVPDGMIEAMQHMELMVKTWPAEKPQEVPLEAIFYTAGEYEGNGLAGARLIQRDYNLVTGKVVPIVRFTTDPSLPPFSYRVDDQALVR